MPKIASPHKTSHQDGGDDEINITGLVGLPVVVGISVPIVLPNKDGEFLSYFKDNNLVLETLIADRWPALRTGQALVTPGNNRISLRATLKASAALSFYPLFCEPYKGDFANFIGFWFAAPNILRLLTRAAGAETTTTISPFDPTIWHTYEIWYAGGSEVVFVLDGTQYWHTTNLGTIHTREWCLGETDGTVMKVTVKPPYLEMATYYDI